MRAKTGFKGQDQADNDLPPLSKSASHRQWLMDQALSLFAFFNPQPSTRLGGFMLWRRWHPAVL